MGRNYKMLLLCSLVISLLSISCSNRKEVPIEKVVWDQLSKEQKNEVVGTWQDAKVEKTIASDEHACLKDSKYDGKEIYLITFESKLEVLGGLRLYVDIETKKIVGEIIRQ